MASTTNPSPTMITAECALERHESMGLTDVVFKVRNRMVKAPIQMFSDSETFHAFIKKITSDDEVQSLELEKDDEGDFLHFMKYMIASQPRCEIALDVAAYIPIGRFVTKWRFKSIRTDVIREIQTLTMDVIDKIVFARDCCIEEWFVPSLNTYTSLGRSTTLQDVERLGSGYVLKIVQIRAELHQRIRTCVGFDQIVWMETAARSQHDFTEPLSYLFADDISQCDIQSQPVLTSDPEDFYLAEMYFLVEGCLFKSYRHLFEASPIFWAMLVLSVQDDKFPYGYDEARPLHIPSVEKVDFAPFIEMINPRPRMQRDFTLSQWISILKLSTMWEFMGIRQFAVNEIAKFSIDNVRKIQLARDYRIREWLLPALNAYAQQTTPVTIEEVDLLGWQYVLKVIQAREEVVHQTTCVDPNCGCTVTLIPWLQARVGNDFENAIACAFRDEIEWIRLWPQ